MSYIPLLFIGLILTTGACHSSRNHDDKQVESPDRNVSLARGLFLNGTTLFTDKSFPSVSYEKVVPLTDRRFLVLGEFSRQLDDYRGEGFAKIIDSEGRILGSIESAGGIASACQHPSGAVSLLALE